MVMLKAFYPSQFGRKDNEDSRKVYSCNVKEDNNLGLPSPLPHEPCTKPPRLIMSGFFLLTWNLKFVMIVIYRDERSSIYHSDDQLSKKNRMNPRGWCTTKLSHDCSGLAIWFSVKLTWTR